MFFPISIQKLKNFKNGPWPTVKQISNEKFFMTDGKNFAIYEINSGKIYTNFKELNHVKQEICAVLPTSSGKSAILVLKSAKIIIFELSSMTVLQVLPNLPNVLNEAIEDITEQDETAKSFKLKNLLGIQKHINHDFSQKLSMIIDFNENSKKLVVIINNDILTHHNGSWHMYNCPVENTTCVHEFFDTNIDTFTTVHFDFQNAILVFCQLFPRELVCSQLNFHIQNASKIMVQSTFDPNLQAVVIDDQLYLIYAQSLIKPTHLIRSNIIGIEFTHQNNFILALSDTGQIFLLALNGEKVLLSVEKKAPKYFLNTKAKFLVADAYENKILASNGIENIIIQLPQELEKDCSILDLIFKRSSMIMKSLNQCEMKKSKKQIDLRNFLRGHYNFDPKQILEYCYDAILILTTIKCCNVAQIRKYSRKVFKNMQKCLNECSTSTALNFVDKFIGDLSRMPLSFKFGRLFINVINILTVNLSKENLSELFQRLKVWTLTLEANLSKYHICIYDDIKQTKTSLINN